MRAPPGGWRALGAFWALLAVGLIGGGVAIDRLGPPTPPGRPALPPISEATPAPGPAAASLVAPLTEAGTGKAEGESPPAVPAPVAASPASPSIDTAATPSAGAGSGGDQAANAGNAPAGSRPAAPVPAAQPTAARPNEAATAPLASPPAAVATAPTPAIRPAEPAATPLAVAPAATPAATLAAPPPGAEATAASPLPDAPTPPPLSTQARVVPQPDRAIAAIDPGLQEAGRHGPLPRVGPDGRTAIRTYARAFDRSDTRPRIGIVLGGIGLSASLSEEAIRRLPGAVALAFSPYANRPEPLIERARARGMETLSALPMEPAGYPLNDPGDWAMLTGLAPEQNLDRMEWSLSRIAGQVGAVGALGAMRGERYAAVPNLLLTLEDHLRSRGLLYIDPRPGNPGPERAWGRTVDLVIDEPATRGEIDRRLAELERIALERGSALGIAADPAPVTVERLASWSAGLAQRGLVLAPVSVLIRRPEGLSR